jgi:hypothetical protein
MIFRSGRLLLPLLAKARERYYSIYSIFKLFHINI